MRPAFSITTALVTLSWHMIPMIRFKGGSPCMPSQSPSVFPLDSASMALLSSTLVGSASRSSRTEYPKWNQELPGRKCSTQLLVPVRDDYPRFRCQGGIFLDWLACCLLDAGIHSPDDTGGRGFLNGLRELNPVVVCTVACCLLDLFRSGPQSLKVLPRGSKDYAWRWYAAPSLWCRPQTSPYVYVLSCHTWAVQNYMAY